MRRLPLLLPFAVILTVSGGESASPSISRLSPLGGQQGTELELEILGQYLSNVTAVEFDCLDISWIRTSHASSGRLSGTVAVARDAPLGAHFLRVLTKDGNSGSVLFNVGQFPSVPEAEPNDRLAEAQPVPDIPVAVQGILDGAADIDTFAIEVGEGERRSIELRSIEHGSAVEAKMYVLGPGGRRVAFNDDRDDYRETPFIDHTFRIGGRYFVKIDQYRGPRGFNFGKNSAYTLRITELPTIRYASPLGAAIGTRAEISLHGSGLGSVERAFLTLARGAEHARMTFPYTMPVAFRPDPPRAEALARIEGTLVRKEDSRATARFEIPDDVETGLWRLWAGGPAGVSDGPLIELGSMTEYSEAGARAADWRDGGYVINGALEAPGEQDVYSIHTTAGQPLHFWTLATQLGVPHLDPVLTLRDSAGRRIQENDDVVAGQGTLLGNPDSSLFHVPEKDGVLFLCVKDRTARGGPSYQYRLKVRGERPGFQLFTTPENVTAPRGGEARIKVHLVREAGFEGEVSVWFDALPPGMEAPRGTFRADQLFVPNADGADMIIPEIAFRIPVPESLPPGRYPIRILGTPTPEERLPRRRVVEARSTLVMGPLLDLWNFVRRPLPRVELTVVEPFGHSLAASVATVSLEQGGRADFELTSRDLPSGSSVVVKGLPPLVRFESRRDGDRVLVSLAADPGAGTGLFDISAEALLDGRWVQTGPIALTVRPAAVPAPGR